MHFIFPFFICIFFRFLCLHFGVIMMIIKTFLRSPLLNISDSNVCIKRSYTKFICIELRTMRGTMNVSMYVWMAVWGKQYFYCVPLCLTILALNEHITLKFPLQKRMLNALWLEIKRFVTLWSRVSFVARIRFRIR